MILGRNISKLLLFLFIFFLISCNKTPYETVISGNTMGTSYTIKFSCNDGSFDSLDALTVEGEAYYLETVENIKNDVDYILNNLNNYFSTYMENSEISKINNSKLFKIKISEQFFYVLNKALYYCILSNGLYDITVLPLTKLWGFLDYDDVIFPSELSIISSKNNIGYKNIETDFKKNTSNQGLENYYLIKQKPNINIDLNSIVKGHAVDVLYEYFLSHGYINFLIEIGGEIRTSSNDKKEWIVGVQHPLKNTLVKKIKLNNMSMATSGTYNNYFKKDNVVYSHIINPISGYPIEHKILSVTVISNNCIDADAIATMLMLLDWQEGLELINSDLFDTVECFIIVKDGEGFSEKYSDGFLDFIVN